MNKQKITSDEYILGIDYGETNIGIALGKSGLVAPIKVILAKNMQTALNEIIKFIFENKVARIVVGLPLDAEGRETKKAIAIRRFAKTLRTLSKKPLDFQNEFATTIGAEEEMIEFEVSQKKRRIKDHYAAALILKQYYSGKS